MPAVRVSLFWIGVLGVLVGPAQAQGFLQLTLDSTYTFRDHTFGRSLALDDNFLFVGSPGDYNNESYAGAVHVYQCSGDQWIPRDTLFASDGGTLHQFGYQLAQEGKHLLVSSRSSEKGVVYVFENEQGRWVERGTLPPP